MGITWASEHFADYLLGLEFRVETDHKPLVPLLSTRNLEDLPARVQRFRMRMMRFTYSISHVPGKSLYTADTLSWAPLVRPLDRDEEKLEADVPAYVDSIVKYYQQLTIDWKTSSPSNNRMRLQDNSSLIVLKVGQRNPSSLVYFKCTGLKGATSQYNMAW